MRAKRLRRNVESTIFPSYELVLKPDEEARATTKTLENVEKGSKLMIKCTMSSNDQFDKIIFRANNEPVGIASGDNSKELMINSFSRDHVGIYECGATRKSDGKYHSRQLRVTQRRENTLKLPSCPEEDAGFCGDHGACFLDGPRKICHCDDGYMGENCDKVLMAAYDVKFLRVIGGTTTSLNLICLFLTIMFGVLWWKEKTAFKKLRKQMVDIETDLEIEKLERESCLEKCRSHSLPPSVHPAIPEASSNPSFARNSIRKMRNAFRTRLNATSDSRLLEK